jgi:paraquat-inducible protein B
LKVGSIQSYQLRRDNQGVVLGVHIEPEYSDLVNGSTRFWNASGISLSGGLSGIEVKSESLQTLLAGGVAFDTPDLSAPRQQRKVPSFQLYADRAAAFQEGVRIRIRVGTADGLKPGTPLRYKGLDVGRVDAVALTDDLGAVVLEARVTSNAERIAAQGAQFWVVRPELGLARTANLDTLVSGQYLEVQPAAAGVPQQLEFVALSQAPGVAIREQGLRLVLSAPRRGSIKAGVPVTYREIPVGRVTGFELGPNADRVLIDILIEPRYAPLVRTGSRFWNTSGFGFDFGLIKGATLRTESLETLIEGGIAFATPDGEQMGSQAIAGQTFPMFAEAKDEWLQWAPKIPLQPQ